MTRVTFYQNRNGQLTGFEAADHAGYAEAGEDIVCAAVSALVIHTINSVERFTSQDADSSADEENAVIHFSLKGEISHDAELLLKSLAQTLSDMQEEDAYKDFVDVNFMEV
uniref:ribosomal-processing cysteine protease Prp n=1 Tax=Eubacterium cellulosolvens TaxID=29322 RepID=UPI0004855DBE|nr:ribosomal-processing cysteine protease Prp [[Eubacterium] cellulosolvens]